MAIANRSYAGEAAYERAAAATDAGQQFMPVEETTQKWTLSVSNP